MYDLRRLPGEAMKNMTRQELLHEMRDRLIAVHGDRFRGAVLYGSEARGEATADSDIDVLVLLAEPIEYGRDLEANIRALYDLSLQLGRRISPIPASAREYETYDCPLYRAAHREGIVA
jgi:predicted nucleotidyltransferase